MPPRGDEEPQANCLSTTALYRMVRRADLVVPSDGAATVLGCRDLALDELRTSVHGELKRTVLDLAPACWPFPAPVASRVGEQPASAVPDILPGPVLASGSDGVCELVPGHVIGPKHVMGALDSVRCLRAQSTLARPGARVDALHQCNSLTQLVRCVLGQTGGVVDQLVRGIAVEHLTVAAANAVELVRAFDDVPVLIGLLPRRDQAAPGRLLMAQQRLLLAHLGEHEHLAEHIDGLDFEMMLKTLEFFEDQTTLPRNWRQGWLDAPACLASLAVPSLGTEKPRDPLAASIAQGIQSDAEPEPEPEEATDATREHVNACVAPTPECEGQEMSGDENHAHEKQKLDHMADEKPLRTQIIGVLAQVHPDLDISVAGCALAEDLLFDHVEPQLISSAWQRVRERLVEESLAKEAAVAHAACASAPRQLDMNEMEVSAASAIIITDRCT